MRASFCSHYDPVDGFTETSIMCCVRSVPYCTAHHVLRHRGIEGLAKRTKSKAISYIVFRQIFLCYRYATLFQFLLKMKHPQLFSFSISVAQCFHHMNNRHAVGVLVLVLKRKYEHRGLCT